MLENTVEESGAHRPHVPDARQFGEQINEAYAGDIVAVVGLKDTTTGGGFGVRRIR